MYLLVHGPYHSRNLKIGPWVGGVGSQNPIVANLMMEQPVIE